MSAGLRLTTTPAASRAAIFSSAVPLPPRDDCSGVTHALAGRSSLAGDEGGDRLLMLDLMNSAALISALPPISPIISIASVCGSA